MRFVTVLTAVVLLSRAVAAGTVIIRSVPRGAAVTVDGQEIGRTPLRVRLDAGLHDLTIEGAGYKKHAETVSVPNKLLQYVATLRLKTYPVDILFKDLDQTGWLIGTNRLQLTEDGQFAVAPTTIMLPKGKYVVRLMKAGFRDLGAKVTVDGKNRATVEIDTKPSKGYSSIDRFKLAMLVGLYRKPDSGGVQMRFNADGTFKKTKAGSAAGAGKWEFVVDAQGKMSIRIVFSHDGFTLNEHFSGDTGTQLDGSWKLIRVTEN